jgi:transposase
MAWHKRNPVSQGLVTNLAYRYSDRSAGYGAERLPQRARVCGLGLVPGQNSTGGEVRLGGISNRGNRYLRRLLINGASTNLLRSKATNADAWVIGLRRRRPSLVVTVALANKTAGMAVAAQTAEPGLIP